MQQPLAPQDPAEEVALFRSQVIGELCRRDLSRGELCAELRALSKKRFRPPKADTTKTFSVPTLERWYYRYKKGGLCALQPKPRSDKGHARALTKEQAELVCDIRTEPPCASSPLILSTLEKDGRLHKGAVTASTLNRFFLDKGLDRVALEKRPKTRARLRWQTERPNALWHADVCHGPQLVQGERRLPLRIHALLDDHSRYIVAIAACTTEKESDMLTLMVSALRRHGAPDALYLDNGSTYRGQALHTGCERLGITLLHARPYDAPARGKMERFWRTLRESCLAFLGECASLHEVNVRLLAFLDQHYHPRPHGALMGKTPAQVFCCVLDRPPDSLTEDKLRKALTVKERRRVTRDATLSIDGTLYELDRPFLCGRFVTIVRCLVHGADPPHVEHEGQRILLHKVDPHKNAKTRRQPLPAPAPKNESLRFDPPSAMLSRALGRRLSCQEVDQ